jgi:hypothetical protein
MPTPSLLIVPARFKTGKLYTQIATTSAGLVLGSSGDFNFTRATIATRFNSAGLIESVASGVPRLDYYTSGGTAGCPALLVEASGSNAFIQSQTLFTSHLVQNLTTAGYENVAISPDGTQNAEKFVPNATNGVHGIADVTSQTITSGTTYSFSCFAKSDGGTNFPLIVLQLDSSTAWGATRNAIFNVVSGTIHGSAPSGVTMRIENYGSGWYRFSATITAVGSVSGTFQYRIYVPNSSATLSYAAASGNTEGVLVWGVQVETGSVATSYIPTTTAAVTRNADVISVSGAVSGSIGQTEGTIYAEVDIRNFTNGSRIVCLSDGTSDNRIILQEGANSTLQAIVTNATSGVVDISTASGRTAGIYKIAIGYKQDDFAVYVNGSQTGTDNTGGVPACNQIFIGKIETTATTNQLNDRIRSVALYTTRLTNAELQSLTTL